MGPRLEQILPDAACVAQLADGFMFTEGPVWDMAGGCLHFSDIPGDRIYQWSPRDGLTVFRAPSGKSNGMTRDREGRLIVCEHFNRRITRTEHDGSVTTLASHFRGHRLNSPNDVVVRSDGAIYFTDPPYGLGPVFGVEAEPELPFAGVYRIAPEGGEPELLISEMVPNGLAFSPDESLLYVADTERNLVAVFDLDEDGRPTAGRLFARIEGDAAPDGIKLDREGRLYVTGHGGVWVLAPSGAHLGVIPVPEPPANLAWGGQDWRTLFVTARSGLYAIRLRAAGIPLPDCAPEAKGQGGAG